MPFKLFGRSSFKGVWATPVLNWYISQQGSDLRTNFTGLANVLFSKTDDAGPNPFFQTFAAHEKEAETEFLFYNRELESIENDEVTYEINVVFHFTENIVSASIQTTWTSAFCNGTKNDLFGMHLRNYAKHCVSNVKRTLTKTTRH